MKNLLPYGLLILGISLFACAFYVLPNYNFFLISLILSIAASIAGLVMTPKKEYIFGPIMAGMCILYYLILMYNIHLLFIAYIYPGQISDHYFDARQIFRISSYGPRYVKIIKTANSFQKF